MRLIKFLLSMALLPLLAACATQPPAGLEAAEVSAVNPKAAQSSDNGHAGERVRWGGEILSVDNLAAATDIEIYSRPLMENAEPVVAGGDGVRFIARVPGFVDPAEYQAGRLITIKGRLMEPKTRKVGQYPYRYPRIAAEHYHLWPERKSRAEEHWQDPYFHDPWWPWGPRWHHPYYPYW